MRVEENPMFFVPHWFHSHGVKMGVQHLDMRRHLLVIGASAARVVIRKASSLHPHGEGWFVDWKVVQCAPSQEGTRGRCHFSNWDLGRAFGLSEGSGAYGDWLIQQFRADSAEQGKYIRQGKFLNIPGPGTGHDGDPNISIYIDDEMCEAIRRLLAHA